MNPAFVVTIFTAGDTKKQLAVVCATTAVVLALPLFAVFSLGNGVVSFLAGTPNAEAAATQGFYMGGAIEGNTYAWGNCTYWSFAMRLWAGSPIPTSWGNANTWDDRAIRDGYEVNATPRPGALFQTDTGDYGHVAYVTSVDPVTGRWTISEMNARGLNIVSTRTFTKESAAYYSFIHTKKGSALWTPRPIPQQ